MASSPGRSATVQGTRWPQNAEADKDQAVGQICSTASMKTNLEQCVRLVAKAAVGGAKVRGIMRWDKMMMASGFREPGNESSFVLLL